MSGGERKYQPDSCKKCGDSGFYYPNPYDETKFDKLDKFGNIVAFDPKYNTPHWYVCPSNPKGLENRRKIEDSRKIGSGQSTIEKSLDLEKAYEDSSKVSVMDEIVKLNARFTMIENDIKRIEHLLNVLVQRTEPVG